MSSVLHFTATKLNGTGKEGTLTPDADGYYEIVVGGLNTFNSAGEYYTRQGAEELFKKSSIFMRRVASGCLKAELGHPKRRPGESDDSFIQRVLTIEETNVCAHIADVWLDFEYGKKNPQFGNPELVGIMARLKPAGPMGHVLKASLDNKSENVCFSIRSLTKDFYSKGVNRRTLSTIVTWDYVNEPGIKVANKWDSPALESLTSDTFSIRKLNDVVNKMLSSPIATENSNAILKEVQSVFSLPREGHREPKKTIYSDWK